MASPPGIVEVRCVGCEETMEVEHGLTEFACPDCGMAQALPLELMPRRPRRALPLPGRGAPFSATPSRVSCGGCDAILSVPHGHGSFSCPLCGMELTASQPAAVSVIAPPVAIPITPNRPAQPSEVRAGPGPGPSSLSVHSWQFRKPIRSEQKSSFREESFSSFGADTGTEIPVTRRQQNGHANTSPHRKDSHIEYTFAAGTESFRARKVQKEYPNQDFYASEAQGMPLNSTIQKGKAEGLPNDTATITGSVVPSIIEHEQRKSLHHVDDVHEVGEIPNNVVHKDQAQLDFGTKATEKEKKSSKNSKANQKRKNMSVLKSSGELPHLRRSKRLAKGSPDLVDPEPIKKVGASTNQSQSEGPCIEKTLADSDPSYPVQYPFPHGGSNELDDVDTTTPPPLNHDALQADQLQNIQMYSPETRWAVSAPSSNSWHEHEIPQKRFSGIDQLNRDHEEVLSDPNQDMDWQLTQEVCSDKNHSGHEALYSDALPGSVSNPSKKRRGRAPEKLMEPRKEADRPVLTPNGPESWSVHPPCPKVANTFSLVIKQNYPGTYLSVDASKNSQPCEHVVYHWHQCPPDIRSTILTEFLKRYRWSPGQEEECQKIFDRKAVRQLFNLFCHEKQRAKQQLAAKKSKKPLVVHKACGMELEDREDSEVHQGDESIVVPEHEDPRKWKPFVPRWMKPKWWEMLCDHWATDEVMKVSYQKRKNRNSGKRPCNTAASRSIPVRQQQDMDNVEKLACDIDSPTKTPGGKGVSLDQNACETEEAGSVLVGSNPLQGHDGSSKHGLYCGVLSVCSKVQNDLSKSSQGCVSKQGQQPMFTKEQVKEMINQALKGLNEVWEQKFSTLEQKMPGASSSYAVLDGTKVSSDVARRKQCQLSREDTLDSVDGENRSSAREDDGNQDEEHSS